MENNPSLRMRSPWIVVIFVVVACGLCLMCGAAGAAVYFLTKPAAAVNANFSAREMGKSDAVVVVEVFGDFQCPACKIFADTAHIRLKEEYVGTGKIRYLFRNFIVVDFAAGNGHESHDAAMSALCAGGQGKFWEYHDILFRNQAGENQGAFSITRLESFAAELHLDEGKFSSCLKESTYQNILDMDARLARSLNLIGTPSLVVNGELVKGQSPDYQWLFDAIDRALEAAGE